jgi:hypothetical protein
MKIWAVDEAPPLLPSGTALAGRVRRPGDVHDAIEIPPGARQAIELKAQAAAIPAALAVVLLLELYLLETEVDAAAAGILPAPPEPVVALRLPAAFARLAWRQRRAASTNAAIFTPKTWRYAIARHVRS